MFRDYFKNELQKLHEIGTEFSKDNPVLAPLLDGSSADPDVERILQGTAFLTANINRKLDDKFPEIIYSLLQIIDPQYLQPVPATTVMEFSPKSNLTEPLQIKKGTYIDSIPVDNTVCRFKTCYDMTLSPLTIRDVRCQQVSVEGSVEEEIEIELDFNLNGISLDNWNEKELILYLGGDYGNATDLYYLLLHFLKEISISNDGGKTSVQIEKDKLDSDGFAQNEALVPFPKNLFPGFRILREYFLFPEKFMFLRLNIEDWIGRGEGNQFSVSFKCAIPPFSSPKIDKKSFHLHCVPAVNLFQHGSDPVQLKQHQIDVPIEPSGALVESFEVFSIDQVTGFQRSGEGKRTFDPFEKFLLKTGKNPIYQPFFRPSPKGDSLNLHISLAYPPEETISNNEIINVSLTCTNQYVPDSLRAGDISTPTTNTPELATFKNLTAPTLSHSPQLSEKVLWKLLSGLTVNSNALSGLDAFKSLLMHSVIEDGRDKPREIANSKRMNSITELEVRPEERLCGKSLYRGQEIKIKIKSDQFVSSGDMFLFGTILDRFLGTYSSFNTYTALIFEDTVKWETIKWPARLGARPLV